MIKPYMNQNKKYYEVYVCDRDLDKKIIARRKRGITSEREAKEIEFQFKTELRAIAEQKPVWTWKKWTEEVLKRIQLRFKVATLQNYESYLNKWVTKDWLDRPINEISPEDVHNMIRSSAVGLSPISQHSFLKILKRIFEEAVEDGHITNNPCKRIKIKVPESCKKVLTTTEVDQLISSAKEVNHRFYPIWCFAVKTGMRSGEIYALLWSDIDFERNLISVTKQWTKKDGTQTTKSGYNRLVPISQDLRDFLIEYKNSLKEKRDFVFEHLEEWTHGEQAKVLKEFCKGIGITTVKFHDLRATFITNMLSQGVPLVKVMAIVGHKRMQTTDIYLRLAGVDIQGATEALSYSLPTQQNMNNVVAIGLSLKKTEIV